MSVEDRAQASLESRLQRLEALVAALERDDLELEEALGLFEEGIAHLRAAREVLRHAELRIEKLVAEEADTATDEATEPAEGAPAESGG